MKEGNGRSGRQSPRKQFPISFQLVARRVLGDPDGCPYAAHAAHV